MKQVYEMRLSKNLVVRSEVEGATEEDCLLQNALKDFRGYCKLCKNTIEERGFALNARTVDDNKYSEVVCCKCKGVRKFGHYKQGGLFLKNWEEGFKKESGVATNLDDELGL